MGKKEDENDAPIEAAEEKKNNSLAIVSMVFGVVSLTGPGLLFGIPAIIMASIALKRKQGDKGLSITGLVTGILSTVFSLLLIGLVIFAVIWSVNHPEYMEETAPRDSHRLERSERSET